MVPAQSFIHDHFTQSRPLFQSALFFGDSDFAEPVPSLLDEDALLEALLSASAAFL